MYLLSKEENSSPSTNTNYGTNLRKYLILTPDKVKRILKVRQERISQRLQGLFKCSAIVIAKEKDQDNANHLNAAVLNENATRYNAAKLIRQAFPEWEGMLGRLE